MSEGPSGDGEDGEAEAEDPFVELEDVDADDAPDPFVELEDIDDAPLGERTPASVDDLFEEVDRVDFADEDAVVERVLEGERAGGAAFDGPAASTTDPVTAPEMDGASARQSGVDGDDPGRDEVVVPKRRYCEGCQYFTEPPETACEHPGTDILELVDADHFLVADCPVVEWRRDLEAYPDPSEAATDPRE
jgi:hypothetical protein